MVGYRNPLQTARPAGLHEFARVSLALFVGDSVISRPIVIARRMNLKIATVIMCSLVHECSPDFLKFCSTFQLSAWLLEA
jgi:hypothetical protein